MASQRPALLIAAALVAAACGGSGTPELRFEDSVPQDLRELAGDTWDQFTEVFAGRTDCFDSLTLLATFGELGGRAEYQPEERAVLVRVPGTAPQLQNSLVHEFAHHVEFSCPRHAELRSDFLAAQGLAPDTEWFVAPTWEQTPSEQFAEAAVEVVLGRRTANLQLRLSDEAEAVVRRWARGE